MLNPTPDPLTSHQVGMKYFGRTLRLVLRYPWTLAASTCCAILVAILWGGNIRAMYPIVEIIFGDKKGQTLQQWIDRDRQGKDDAGRYRGALSAALEKRLVAASGPASETGWKRNWQANKPICLPARQSSRDASGFVPISTRTYRTAFQTIVLVVVLVIVGTLLKDLFLVLDAVLVDRLTNLVAMELAEKFYRRTLRMELASFSDSKTAELTARFTADMDSLHGGVQTLLGRAVREPLKMLACFIGAGYVCWALAGRFAPGGASDCISDLAARRLAEACQPASDGRNHPTLFDPGRNLRDIKIVKAFTSERHERQISPQ